MKVEEEIASINSKLETILRVISEYPGLIGKATMLIPNLKKGMKPRFKKELQKSDIRRMLVKKWNDEHPLFPMK